MLLLASFAINVDTTIVNIALPSLVRQLDASTRELQWIVDAYALTFAALVLAAGSVSDRYGRKGALLTGLAVFGIATTAGGFVDSPGALIAVRAVMGVRAAIIFPATLSIISNIFTERVERARAIGLWGATTGLGVALGPITGGWLLEHFWWGSVFLAMAPVAAAAFVTAAKVLPTSRDPQTPRLDVVGLVLSTVAVAAITAAVFVSWERRASNPMLDVTLFRNLRFSAASGSIMVAFFALSTQYFQFLRGHSPLDTGVRMLPVAISLVFGSIVGVRLSVAIGNKAVVATGLTLVGVSYAWTSFASTATPYLEIAAQLPGRLPRRRGRAARRRSLRGPAPPRPAVAGRRGRRHRGRPRARGCRRQRGRGAARVGVHTPALIDPPGS